MSRFSTVISYTAFLAALLMIGLGITGMVTAARGQEAPQTAEEVQQYLDVRGQPYRAFGVEETKAIYALIVELAGPSPEGEPAAYIFTISPNGERAVLIPFDVEGKVMRYAFSGPASQIIVLVTAAVGRFAHD